MVEACSCPDALKWRAYWTHEAIAERLAAEIALYRDSLLARERDACNDARGPRRVGVYEDGTPYMTLGAGPAFEEMERRRAEPGVWPPPGSSADLTNDRWNRYGRRGH